MTFAKGLSLCVPVLALVLAGSAVQAEDLGDARELLCVALHVMSCQENGKCNEATPESEDVPRFMEFDLDEATLSTTRASGRDLSTPLKNVEHADGLILIHGSEEGHTYSWVVNERTGHASGSVAMDGEILAIFSACTPMEVKP